MNNCSIAWPLPIFVLAFILATRVPAAGGTWTLLSNLCPDYVETMLLLSDGSVICENPDDATWYRLKPDSTGSYVHGTWSSAGIMHYSRKYFTSVVMTNGQLLVAGGEYGGGGGSAEVYDPVANTWTLTPPVPGGQTIFYDSIGKMLPNGNVLVAPVYPMASGETAIYSPAANTWTAGPTLYRGYDQDEASWVKLPDDSILTIDPDGTTIANFGTNSERFIPSQNAWVNDATLPVKIYDSYGLEMGAAFLLADGRAFFMGGTGNTVFYTPTGTTNAGTWQAGPVIPNSQATVDAPAAMMVNGKILLTASPAPHVSNNATNVYNSPTSFYEFDPVANAFNQVNGPYGLWSLALTR